MIFDTDVLVWFLRGNSKAVDTVLNSSSISISVVTYMELLQGARDKQEIAQIKRSLGKMGVQIVPISESISSRAAELVEQFTLSNSMELADALIAATCLSSGEPLITANDKHYKVVKGLDFEVFRP